MEANESVYPCGDHNNIQPEYGISKREYFAGLAMSSYYGGEFTGQSGMPFEHMAKNCVEMADALINALNQ